MGGGCFLARPIRGSRRRNRYESANYFSRYRSACIAGGDGCLIVTGSKHASFVVALSAQVVFTQVPLCCVLVTHNKSRGSEILFTAQALNRSSRMKSRIPFYFAAIIALVLTFSAIPSNATERRDPLMIQDTVQTTPSARTAEAGKETAKHRKAARPAKHGQVVHSSKPAVQKSSESAK